MEEQPLQVFLKKQKFKPPFRSLLPQGQHQAADVGSGRTADVAEAPSHPFKRPRFTSPCIAGRQPLTSIGACPAKNAGVQAGSTRLAATEAQYYSVMYCEIKRGSKRNGPWMDGIIITGDKGCSLISENSKTVANSSTKINNAADGFTFQAGKYNVEIMKQISKESYLSGRVFAVPSPSALVRPRSTMTPVSVAEVEQKKVDKIVVEVPEGAVVLNARELIANNKAVPVFIDLHLGKQLRQHQVEGVKFMYEAVMGLQDCGVSGCLLADEMGLGKTLQVIALIWTLLKQGPQGKPSIKRAVIVAPSTLVQNWGNEVNKWLGRERLRTLIVHAAAGPESKFADFKNGTVSPVLIASYELARKHADLLAAAHPDLLVCDEGHRLKNSAGNKTIDALISIDCPKKVILTGTPIQNDLMEFYSLLDFIVPGFLGNHSSFKRLYADPIHKSRERDASEEEKELGEARSLELQRKTKVFVIRRTAEVNAKYLPQKKEYIVFCALHPRQVDLYFNFLQSQEVVSFLSLTKSSTNALTAILSLRKICNHPWLLRDMPEGQKSTMDNEAADWYCDAAGQAHPRKVDDSDNNFYISGKMNCLFNLLCSVADSNSANQHGMDKVVIVSNFTQTLDIIQRACEERHWKLLRLDGNTEVTNRQSLVNRFNSPYGKEFVFLLSAKAGGAGLNLIGANRLVLFDPDWNPATDLQAMARIWRDGQKKGVVIYRLLSTGSIDEKIYQRQVMKGEVAASVASADDAEKRRGKQHFTREELKELFTLRQDTACDTLEILERAKLQHADRWKSCLQNPEDKPLQAAIDAGGVTYVLQHVEEGRLSGFNGKQEEEFPSSRDLRLPPKRIMQFRPPTPVIAVEPVATAPEMSVFTEEEVGIPGTTSEKYMD